MSTIRISVLSDDRLFCESVLRLIGEEPDAIFADAGEDLPVDGNSGEVAILDARMPDALRWCTTLSTDPSAPTSVIFVGAPDEDAWAEAALAAGARGILTKTARGEDLAKAIHVVADDGIWARRRWLNASMRYFAATRSRPPRAAQLASALSGREREVFEQAALGASNKELADRLDISEATVKAHLTHIFQKLGVTGRAELAAAYHGLLQPARSNARAPGLPLSGERRTSNV